MKVLYGMINHEFSLYRFSSASSESEYLLELLPEIANDIQICCSQNTQYFYIHTLQFTFRHLCSVRLDTLTLEPFYHKYISLILH